MWILPLCIVGHYCYGIVDSLVDVDVAVVAGVVTCRCSILYIKLDESVDRLP